MFSWAAWILTGCGTALVLVGVYFLFARPPLLAEDARFMGSTVEHLADAVPALPRWLQRVFWVLGGYIATTGLLVIYIATTGVRGGSAGAIVVLAGAGIASLGWMTAVNFMIRSDFKWALLGLAGLWASGLILATAAQ